MKMSKMTTVALIAAATGAATIAFTATAHAASHSIPFQSALPTSSQN
jgi:hypothetical protein